MTVEPASPKARQPAGPGFHLGKHRDSDVIAVNPGGGKHVRLISS
jgi:hypothetical protein